MSSFTRRDIERATPGERQPFLKQAPGAGPTRAPPKVRTGTFYGTTVNMANAAIGAGILAFPSGFG